MTKTDIEWAGSSKNPAVGCGPVSEGCLNCYAGLWVQRWDGDDKDGNPRSWKGLTKGNGKGKWSGLVHLNPKALVEIIQRKKPETYFLGSLTDIFYDRISYEYRCAIFATALLAPQHTLIIPTKRHKEMEAFFHRLGEPACMELILHAGNILGEYDVDVNGIIERLYIDKGQKIPWPLPNIWLGVSVENQARADERIPTLLQTPAAVRFVSAEPLLGPVNLRPYLQGVCPDCGHTGYGHEEDMEMSCQECGEDNGAEALDWVIVGGESGRNARPCHPDWIRDLRDQCANPSRTDMGGAWDTRIRPVAFFLKQYGAWLPGRRPRNERAAKNAILMSPDGAKRGRGAGSLSNHLHEGDRDVWLWPVGKGKAKTKEQHRVALYNVIDGERHLAFPDGTFHQAHGTAMDAPETGWQCLITSLISDARFIYMRAPRAGLLLDVLIGRILAIHDAVQYGTPTVEEYVEAAQLAHVLGELAVFSHRFPDSIQQLKDEQRGAS